jgi:hypothetical protein
MSFPNLRKRKLACFVFAIGPGDGTRGWQRLRVARRRGACGRGRSCGRRRRRAIDQLKNLLGGEKKEKDKE